MTPATTTITSPPEISSPSSRRLRRSPSGPGFVGATASRLAGRPNEVERGLRVLELVPGRLGEGDRERVGVGLPTRPRAQVDDRVVGERPVVDGSGVLV